MHKDQFHFSFPHEPLRELEELPYELPTGNHGCWCKCGGQEFLHNQLDLVEHLLVNSLDAFLAVVVEESIQVIRDV